MNYAPKYLTFEDVLERQIENPIINSVLHIQKQKGLSNKQSLIYMVLLLDDRYQQQEKLLIDTVLNSTAIKISKEDFSGIQIKPCEE